MGGFGHSLDIGKELEKEKEIEELQRQLDEPANEEAQQEAPEEAQDEPAEDAQDEPVSAEEDAEKPSEEPAPAQEPVPDKEPADTESASAETQLPELRLNRSEPSPSAEELLNENAEDDEPEPAPPRVPDPVEEDVEAMMTKHVPEAEPRASFGNYRIAFVLIVLLAIGGWWVVRMMHAPAAPLEASGAVVLEQHQVENMTVLDVSQGNAPPDEFGALPLADAPVEEIMPAAVSAPEPVAPAPEPDVAAVSDVPQHAAPQHADQLQDILIQGLQG